MVGTSEAAFTMTIDPALFDLESLFSRFMCLSRVLGFTSIHLDFRSGTSKTISHICQLEVKILYKLPFKTLPSLMGRVVAYDMYGISESEQILGRGDVFPRIFTSPRRPLVPSFPAD